jgi:hypothetical protein
MKSYLPGKTLVDLIYKPKKNVTLLQQTIIQFMVKLSGASGGNVCNSTIAFLDYLIEVANHFDIDFRDEKTTFQRDKYVQHQWWASLHDVITALQIRRYQFCLKR